MSIYLTLFYTPFILFLINPSGSNKIIKVFFLPYLLILIFFVGFKYEVGGDFYNYFSYVPNNYKNLLSTINFQSFLYSLLVIISDKLNGKIYIANFLTSIFVFISLYFFLKKEKNIFICFFIAFPILIMIFILGYTRQSLAFGFFLISLVKLEKKANIQFIIYILIGSMFHISLIPLVLLIFLNYKVSFKFFLIPFFLFIIISIFLKNVDYFQNLFYYYMLDPSRPISQGSIFRLALFPIVSLFYLINIRKFDAFNDKYIINSILILSNILFLISIFVGSIFSTITDRYGLYLIPYQIIIYSRLIYLFDFKRKIILIIFVFFLYSSVFFIWLFFGINTHAWIPYKNILFYNSLDLINLHKIFFINLKN